MEKNNSSLTTPAPFDLSLPTILIVVMTVFGTIFCLIYLWLIFSIIFCRKLRNHSNYLLLSLFVTECGSILVHLMQIHHDINTPFPKISVLLIASAFLDLCYGYYLYSAIVALDRYFKIAKPMQYVRLMSNKVSAGIHVIVWGLLAVTFIGLLVTNISNLEADFISISDLYVNEASLSLSMIVLLDVFAFPCLLTITVSVVALACIARNQQRKIDAERVNLGTIATDRQPDIPNEGARPKRKHSPKLARYSSMYFATIIIAWVPNIILLNVVAFHVVPLTQGVFVVLYIINGIAVMQMVLGALFLVYMQSEHRQVLRDTWKAIRNKFTCKTEN